MKMLIFVSSQSKSKSAVLFGGQIARAIRAEVTLFTVIDKAQKIETAYQVLDPALGWIPDLDVRTAFQVGSEADRILEEVNSGDYDLLVLKSGQAKRIKYFLASQLSRKIAKQSLKSVLVVKKRQPDRKRILICTCGKDIANPVVEWGAYLANRFGAKATLLHVANIIPSMYTGLHRFDEHLSDLLATETPIAQHLRHSAQLLAKEKVDAQIKLRHGIAADEILLEARSGEYGLITIGSSRASSNLAGWMMGDVTQQVVNQSDCPVLVVRQQSSHVKESE